MKRAVLLGLAVVMGFNLGAAAQGVLGPHPALGESMTKDALHAIRIGVEWLESNQREDGAWSNPTFPAITGLAVSAILNSPDVLISGVRSESASRGLEFILDSVQNDGCIYQNIPAAKGGGLPGYNTAVSLMALVDAGDPELAEVIARAYDCLASAQYLGPGVFRGGMGYDIAHDRAYADLSNTLFALEALRKAEAFLADKPVETGKGLDWEAAIEFVSHCQHLRETNSAGWVSDAPEDQGGFVYHPQKSMAGPESGDQDSPDYLRSYGSMTYAGLLSFIYARVDREDPRVLAAFDWINRRWTVEENPGMGDQGLYYYYHTLAKALNAYGKEMLDLPDGSQLAWRPALVRKLISLQKIDPQTGLGYWQNDSNRWWENDPNLVTAYTLLTLETAVFGRGSGAGEL